MSGKTFTLTLNEAEGRLLCDVFAYAGEIFIGGTLGERCAEIAERKMTKAPKEIVEALAGKLTLFQREVKNIRSV